MAAENEVGFQSLFEEVVKAKRLSGSKVQKLQSIALKNMENDTQMVSIIFRTHKGLSPSSKVSSLYVFDALARAARDAIDKKKAPADPTSSIGNCATFLMKLEGILESFIQDLMATKSSEVKEKTKKILDIWIKHRTFPQQVLDRLTSLVSGVTEQDAGRSSTPNSAVPQSTTPPGSPPRTQPKPSNETVENVQNALLALLSQAASAPNNNNAHPSAPSGGQSNPSQFTLLQALAQHAQGAQVAGPSNGVQVNQPVSSVKSPPPPVQRSSTPTGPSRRDDWDRDRHADYRAGPSRGGPQMRGRGRGSYRGARDSPPPRFRRSRSRSPSYNSSSPRRDSRPLDTRHHSPSHRHHEPRQSHQDGKDEFGRDIKPVSPTEIEPPRPNGTGTSDAQDAASYRPIQTTQPSSNPIPPRAPIQPLTSQTKPSVVGAPILSVLSTGLEAFDMSKFDFSSPEAWQRLGIAWQQTHGHAPNQEQLMAFVMSGGAVQLPAGGDTMSSMHGNTGTQGQGRGRGRGNYVNQGGGRGVSVGYARNEDREMNSWEQRGYHNAQASSDAVILGGDQQNGGNAIPVYTDYSQQQHNTGFSQYPNTGFDTGFGNTSQAMHEDNAPQSNSSGGKMQRVGDRWVWQPAS